MKYITFFSLCCIFVCCSSSIAVDVPAPGHQQAVLDAASIPTWYPGDMWTYRVDPFSFSSVNASFTGVITNLQETVTGVYDDTYNLSITGQISGALIYSGIVGDLTGVITGSSSMRRSDLAQGPTHIASSGSILVIVVPVPYSADIQYGSIPLLEAFDFPLAVGDQWRLQGLTTTTGYVSIEGIMNQSMNSVQVVDGEVTCPQQSTITCPAGSFTAYEVGREGSDAWYAPIVDNLVKSTIDQVGTNGTIHAVTILQSFSRATQPLSVSEHLSPDVAFPGDPIVVSGQVLNSQTHAPVADGAVTVRIPATGDSWTTTTNSTGGYSVSFPAPIMVDDSPVVHETGSGGVVVSCSKDGQEGYQVCTLTTLVNNPPAAPRITGPAQGKPRVEHNYVVCSVDSDNDTVSYFVDWGDNTTSDWVGPSASGVDVTLTHKYAKRGTYVIRAKAKDTWGSAESEWGTMQVKMPYVFHPLQWLFGRFPHAFPLLRLLLVILK